MKKILLIKFLLGLIIYKNDALGQSKKVYFESNATGYIQECKRCHLIDSIFSTVDDIRILNKEDMKYKETINKYFESERSRSLYPCDSMHNGKLKITNPHNFNEIKSKYFDGYGIVHGVSRSLIDSLYENSWKKYDFEKLHAYYTSTVKKEEYKTEDKVAKKDAFLKNEMENSEKNGLTGTVDLTYEKHTSSATCSYCHITKSVEILKASTIKFKNPQDINFLLIVVDLIANFNSKFQGFLYMGWPGIFPAECDMSRTGKHNIEVTQSNISVIEENLSRIVLNEKLFEIVYKEEIELKEKRYKNTIDSLINVQYRIHLEQKKTNDLQRAALMQKSLRNITYGYNLGITGDTNSVNIISNSINTLVDLGFTKFKSKYSDTSGKIWNLREQIDKYVFCLLNTGRYEEAVKVMKYVFKEIYSCDESHPYELMAWSYIMAGQKDLGLEFFNYIDRSESCDVKNRFIQNMEIWRTRFPKNKNIAKGKILKIAEQIGCVN